MNRRRQRVRNLLHLLMVIIATSALACSNFGGRDVRRPDALIETVFTFPGVFPGKLIPDDSVIWVLFGDKVEDPRTVAGVPRIRIARIDRQRNTFVNSFEAVPFPGWARRAGADAARGGVIWSSNYFGGTVTAYDPATSRVLLTIPIANPFDMALDDHSVWLTGRESPAGSFLQRHDAMTGAPVVRAAIPLPGACCPVLAYGTLWAAIGRYAWWGRRVESAVLKIDPTSGLVVGRIDIDDGMRVDQLFLANGSIWANNGRTLKKINPRAMTIEATLRDTRGVSLSADGADLWLASWSHHVVQRVDTRTNRVAATYSVNRPFGLAANKGTVWITAGNALLRLQP